MKPTDNTLLTSSALVPGPVTQDSLSTDTCLPCCQAGTLTLLYSLGGLWVLELLLDGPCYLLFFFYPLSCPSIPGHICWALFHHTQSVEKNLSLFYLVGPSNLKRTSVRCSSTAFLPENFIFPKSPFFTNKVFFL